MKRIAISIFLGLAAAAVMVVTPLVQIEMSGKQDRFDPMILKVSAEHGCDPNLVKAVVWRESKFRPEERGDAGEYGLMQVMPIVGKEWAAARGQKQFDEASLLDPETNLRVGTWYLVKALQQWDQASAPIPLALAQYNAGRSNVLKWVDATSMADPDTFIERIQFPTTKAYVRAIMTQYQKYREHGEF